MARCLVTGHKGFIGSCLYKKLKDLGHEVQGIDSSLDQHNSSHNILQELKEGCNNDFYWRFKPEYIFHLACWPRVSLSIEDPVGTMYNNVMATSYVLSFARKVGAKRVIYSSSSSVVGNGNGPTSPYGLQKLTSEMECKLYSELFNLDTVSLRYFNVYSEEQKADGPYATAIANWMEYIRQNLTPFITGDGEQRRDMLHVNDAVNANIFAMNFQQKFNGKNYDVGTGENISLNEIKEIVNKYFPILKFDFTKARPNEVQQTKAKTKLLKDSGWKAEISIEKGINSCFKKLRKEV